MKISSCKSLEVNNCTTYVYGFGSIEIASDECLDFSGLCYRLSWMSTLHPFSHAAATRKQSEVGRGRLVCTGREAPLLFNLRVDNNDGEANFLQSNTYLQQPSKLPVKSDVEGPRPEVFAVYKGPKPVSIRMRRALIVTAWNTFK